jgi:peptidoglycan hydrolase-like protein with peptidoglycan-binding domain
MTHKLLATTIGAVLLLTPVFALADSSTDMQSLMKRIAELQSQLQALQTSAKSQAERTPDAPACVSFAKNLSVGTSGTDVNRLQVFLANQGPTVYPEGKVSSYYGSLTSAAIKRWQYAHGIKVTGILDETTRKAMACGPGESSSSATATPVIIFTASATSTQPGQGTTLRWNVTQASRCVLTHGSGEESVALSGNKLVIPSETTTYSLRCVNATGTSNDGASNQKSVLITIVRPSISVPTDNPTCTLSATNSFPTKGSSVIITWTSQNTDYATQGYQHPRGDASISLNQLSPNGSIVVNPTEPITYIYSFYGKGKSTDCRLSISPQ